jgi:biofilm PGA synthesis N-glycosyltransferase PgaC
LHVDVGIMTCNEERNIEILLESLLSQKMKDVVIDKIIVVSSGSTDRTNKLVLDYQEKDNRVSLINQSKREGKPSAINEFLKNTKNEIVVVSSGDIRFSEKTIESLIAPFQDKMIGMTSTFPVPVNRNSSFMGFVVNMHWRLHNILNRHGESIAFRKKLVKFIPHFIVADEAYVELVIQKKGLEAVNVKDAIVLNKGPETLQDFLKQIRRHFLGHLQLKFGLNYSVASMTKSGIISVLKELVMLSTTTPHKILYSIGYLSLEIFGRILGMSDFIFRNKNAVLWDTVRSTKSLESV